MNLIATTKKEFHDNGNLRYIETIVILDPQFAHLYENRRANKNGDSWIRIGKNQKFKTNGILEWEIIYDQSGNITYYDKKADHL